MLWAACCFAFLCSGEFTIISESQPHLSTCLTPGDIAIDNHSSPKIRRVQIKQSKTDQFQAGIDIHLSRTNTELCPIVAVLSYLAVRGTKVGPLFRFNDGKPLTYQRLVNQVHTALQAQGNDSSRYSGHSFRIGAATTGPQNMLLKLTLRNP